MRQLRSVLIFASIPLMALPTLGQQAEIDFDRGVDFSSFATIAWTEGTPAATTINQRRIEDAVRKRLQAEGLKWVEHGSELLLATHAVSNTETRNRAVNLGVGLSRRTKRGHVSIGGSTGGKPRQITTGTLVIDLLDAGTGELVWRASLSDTLKSGQDMDKKIAAAVEIAFEAYPPLPEEP